jgi:hypothetical protein
MNQLATRQDSTSDIQKAMAVLCLSNDPVLHALNSLRSLCHRQGVHHTTSLGSRYETAKRKHNINVVYSRSQLRYLVLFTVYYILYTTIQILQYSDAMLHYSKPVNTVVRNCHPVMPHALQVCEIWALTRLGKLYEGLYCMTFTCHLVKSFFCLYITNHHAPRTFVLPECVLK